MEKGHRFEVSAERQEKRTIDLAIPGLVVWHVIHCTSAASLPSEFNSNYQKADDTILDCKFSKNIKSKLYHIENPKTRGQTG